MRSIRQIAPDHPLPDGRNFGVMLRILLGANAMAFLFSLAQANGMQAWLDGYVGATASVEPLLLAMLGFLALGRDLLFRLSERLAQAVVIGVAAGLGVVQCLLWGRLGVADGSLFGLFRSGSLAAAGTGALLLYFEMRNRAFSPAIGEARLAALNARIRPHFLFNSLNAVLSLVRAEPKRAEAALEGLADLFRSALRDPREMVPLADEIALGQQYLDLEKLRLGERLRTDWQLGEVPLDTLIPSLMLQPLLENAVYHGIEPAAEGGTVGISLSRRGDELLIQISNPLPPGVSPSAGNQMAVANIRERLALYYDLEAGLEMEHAGGDYLVRIRLPCRSRKSR